jgi:hypothetical protein
MSFNATFVVGGDDYTEYTIRHQAGCILIFGSVPAGDFQSIAKLAPRKAVIDPTAAAMAGANFAFGLREDLENLKASLRANAIARAQQRYSAIGLTPKQIEWLACGERGLSSDTAFQVLTGVNLLDGDRPRHPSDVDDVRRCLDMLDACDLNQAFAPSMRDVSPQWSRLVDRWHAITIAIARENFSKAQSLIDEATKD